MPHPALALGRNILLNVEEQLARAACPGAAAEGQDRVHDLHVRFVPGLELPPHEVGCGSGVRRIRFCE